MAAVPPAPAADRWVDNPNVGNFNPGKKSGQVIFKKKTKSLKEENILAATKKDAQAIRRFLENKALALGKVITQIPIVYDAIGDPTEWGNLLCEYGYIYMNLLQRESHKRFINLVSTVDLLTTAPFTVTTLDPEMLTLTRSYFILGLIHKWLQN